MSTFFMPPRPEGDVGQQVQRQYAYLFQLVQQLNLLMETTDGGGDGGSTTAAVRQEQKEQYQTLRSMIIKTANEVTREVTMPDITKLKQDVAGLQGTTTELGDKTASVEHVTQTLGQLTKELQAATEGLQTTADSLRGKTESLEARTSEQEKAAALLNGETAELGAAISGCVDSINALGFKMSEKYVAISDFGSYIQKINAEITANPEAITQYYSFFSVLKANLDKISADFETYKVGTEGYIRTGIVYYEDGLPVYGVAVGQNLTVTEVDGETVINQTNFRATYTAQKLSFWQDAVEVAYVSNNRLYINNITVLQAITLGRWDIDGTDGLSIKWIGG